MVRIAMTDIEEREKIVLRASGLASKWGFEDGDLLFDVLADFEPIEGEEFHLSFEHEVLAQLVEKRLAPVIERELGESISLVRISTIHNPIRAEGESWTAVNNSRPEWDNVKVELTKDDVLREAELLKAERGNRLK